MHSECPWCGEKQRVSILYVDTMVACRVCGKEFLLATGPRDQPNWQVDLSPRRLRRIWETILKVVFWPWWWLGLG
ncbi:MAG: hypothetical protein KatS3mg105_0183 [Gemmatales bacterium]|nr:MAG: hypothetical protein KatS3mg105_0183 [Gemmatales bacterium]